MPPNTKPENEKEEEEEEEEEREIGMREEREKANKKVAYDFGPWSSGVTVIPYLYFISYICLSTIEYASYIMLRNIY